MSLIRFLPWVGTILGAATLLTIALQFGGWPLWLVFGTFAGLALLGLHDVVQVHHSILRNYPVIGHGRFLMEALRPEIRQYFIEDELAGRPFNREQRAMIYQRAKGQSDYDAFGSELEVHELGYEWIDHSLTAHAAPPTPPRVRVGGTQCDQPYDISLMNVSAMSFGSLGPSAVRALGRGAKQGGYAQCTGEGGISRYHIAAGADLV